MSYAIQKKDGKELNRLYEEDKSVHDWYRFVLSYPPHLVRDYIDKFQLNSAHNILDPFCGTGTTLVESKKLGIPSFGIEANPVVHLAASTKVNWAINAALLLEAANRTANLANVQLKNHSGEYLRLSESQNKLLISNSICELPLHKALVLLKEIEKEQIPEFKDIFKVALSKQAVFGFSNLKFGPEVGVSRKRKEDADVVGLWLEQVESMAFDIQMHKGQAETFSMAHHGDAREMSALIQDKSIDAVITSPPYPNEKDYTRTTRLESVLLGFMNEKPDLRSSKNRLLRSNTRNVYKGDDDCSWVANNIKVQELAQEIEKKRISLGKTSGFEKLYHRVVTLYFGGMAKHLNDLKPKLRNGARLAYVVGDQASYFRTHIHTGEILAEIAVDLGYELIGIDLFRTRISTATQQQLREEVVLLKWNEG